MKFIKARREYKCNNCKVAINKKDLYTKKSISLGTPGKETFDGHYFVSHGLRVTVQFCESCSNKNN